MSTDAVVSGDIVSTDVSSVSISKSTSSCGATSFLDFFPDLGVSFDLEVLGVFFDLDDLGVSFDLDDFFTSFSESSASNDSSLTTGAHPLLLQSPC